MQYRICPDCGAALDPGERCDCANGLTPDDAFPLGTVVCYRKAPMRPLRVASHPFRHNGELCAICKQGTRGNVSAIYAVHALSLYNRKGDKTSHA